MELKDYISAISTFVSAILIIIGWIVIRHKDREQEKFKIRNTRRENLASSYFDVYQYFMLADGAPKFDNDFSKKISKLTAEINLYGTKDEIRAYEEFIDALKNSNEVETFKGRAVNLTKLLIGNIRQEIGLKY
jgi:hypothetical protein